MGVIVDGSGRRSVRVEVEVEGSVDDAWRAVATGAGISSWFVPAEVEVDADGRPTRTTCRFGAGMDATAVVTFWSPPREYTVVSDEFIPGGPLVQTKWRVTRGGENRCVVSVEHVLFSGSDAYDSHVEGTEAGWPAFLRLLQLYMADFRGQPCALLEFMGEAKAEESAWKALATALGIYGAKAGDTTSAPAATPRLEGKIDRAPDATEVIMRLKRPAPGLAHVFLWPVEGRSLLSVRFYLYGNKAADVVASEGPRWRAWVQERFPYQGH